MSDAEFEIIEHAFDLPFRTRNVNAGHIAFRADNLDVYVMTDVASRARQWARGALPRETGGLLAGRILRDNAGQYVVVTGIGGAPAGAGGVGRFGLSPEETEQLRRALARDHPSADVIGWWHSHVTPSSYSATDRANQAIWTDPRSVGLLVFAQGTPWAGLYVGPQSRGPFRPAGPVAALDSDPPETYPPASNPPDAPSRAGGDPPPRAGRDSWAGRRLALAVLIVVMAVGIIALAAKAFLSKPSQDQSVDLSCAVSSNGSTPIARCSVDPVEAAQSITWYLNNSDAVRATGSNATLNLRPGTNVVWVAITYSDHGPVHKYQMNLSA
jgi:hypothetical protein